MTKSNFINSFDSIRSLLISLNIYRQSGVKKIYVDSVSDEFKKASLSQDYLYTYTTAIRNFDYDFLLFDESFFQFSINYDDNPIVPNLRYAFFQNPNHYKSYEYFLDVLREKDIIGDETNDEIGSMFEDDYSQYLIEQQLNQSATTIRYDMDIINYKPMIHSTSHFHLGYGNMVRLPCDKVITPYSFVMFVMKHIYYYQWKSLVEDKTSVIHSHINIIRKNCSNLSSTYWNSVDEVKEFYIT